MKYKVLLIVFFLFLNTKIMASIGNEPADHSSPKFDCKMSKSMNDKRILKLDPKKGSLRFEIPYATMDCTSQFYELNVKEDSLIIVQHDKMETCKKHRTRYFLVGKISNLKKGMYYVNVVQTIGSGVRYNLIKNPIRIEIP